MSITSVVEKVRENAAKSRSSSPQPAVAVAPGSRFFDCRCCRSAVVAILLMAVSTSSVRGQAAGPREIVDTGGLTIEAVAGWDGTVDQSMPVPIAMLISNYSGRDIDGTLVLTNPGRGERVFLGDIYISQSSARTFRSVQGLPDWYECYVSLIQSGEVLWRRELPLSTGSTFDLQTNFALFVEDSDRRLTLPPGRADRSASTKWTNQETGVAGSSGRRVVCLSAKPWQIPVHFGPLSAVQAVIFPENTPIGVLNPVQYSAVAKWMCQGGTVFIHSGSVELLQQLIASAPLEVAPAVRTDDFDVRRVGLGAISVYAAPLFDAGSRGQRQQMAEALATLSRQPAGSLLNTVQLYSRESGRADYNRLMVVAFFGLYTLFSGLIALLLFRVSRRTIAVYAVSVVSTASVLAGVLGGILRMSQGDLRLVTVTQAGVGGIVQSGTIEVQSAGSRNTQVAIQGEHADLQLTEGQHGFSHHYYYHGHNLSPSCPPFTWQPNLLEDDSDGYEIRVPMTPWGTRLLRATAFTRQFPRLDFELEFQPRVVSGPSGDTSSVEVVDGVTSPQGQFILRLRNHLPVTLVECSLMVGATARSAQESSDGSFEVLNMNGDRLRAETVTPPGMIDVYHTLSLGQIAAGETVEQSFAADFQVRNHWDMTVSVQNGQFTSPRISRLGTASAWIVGRLDDSPIVTIEEQRTEFTQHDELHLFVQQILPADMPAVAVPQPPGTASPE